MDSVLKCAVRFFLLRASDIARPDGYAGPFERPELLKEALILLYAEGGCHGGEGGHVQSVELGAHADRADPPLLNCSREKPPDAGISRQYRFVLLLAAVDPGEVGQFFISASISSCS
jgi:hypothetical protein